MLFRRIRAKAAFIAALAMLLSACAQPAAPAVTTAPDITTISAEDTTVSETEAVTEETTSAAAATTVSSTTTETEAPETSDDEAPETDTDGSGSAQESTAPEESVPAEDSGTDETSVPTAVSPETTSESAAPPEETTQTTTSTETAAAATEAVKHDPSPPKISHVSSDGTDVFECPGGVIDYSNASQGYISAKYTGKKADAKIRITQGDRSYNYSLPPDGKYHYFNLSMGSGDYSVLLAEESDEKGYYDNLILGDFKVKITDDIMQFTYPNEYVYFDDNSACVAKASEICGGCKDDVEKIAAVFGFIYENISYDYDLAATVKSFYVADPDKTLKTKKGVCFDYSSLMAAMLRSQGIPTRMIFGYTLDMYHAWNEVYTKETGWITPEVLLEKKGFNLLDSTLYTNTKDKNRVAAHMADNANYTSIYIY